MSDWVKQLKATDVKKLRLKNGNTVEKELKHHAAILADCIQDELDKVYDSYVPIQYTRSYGLYNSLYIDDRIKIEIYSDGTNLAISICFDDGAIHESFSGEKVNTAILLNEGWQTHGSFSGVPYLGYRDGEHFVEVGIEKYKRTVNNPFTVKFTINNEERIF